MIKISLTHNTASSLRFVLDSPVSFSIAKLWMKQDGSDPVELDSYNVLDGKSIIEAMRINQGTGSITIDLNKLPFDSIYYKQFHVQFLTDTLVEVDTTELFQIRPEGKESLYGIVNKLTFEFTTMARFSGTTLRLFAMAPTQSRCPECWDEELGQQIASDCDCGGPSYSKTEILVRKIKTQSKQEYNDTGSKLREQAIFQTYDRPDLIKGALFVDLSDKEIYEVVDRTVANIGGVRTSTILIGNVIKPNDSRVKWILDYLD